MTRQKLNEAVERWGGSIDTQSERYGTIYIDAPEGKLWACDGVKTLAVHFENAVGQRWTREAFADAVSRMGSGLENNPESEDEE